MKYGHMRGGDNKTGFLDLLDFLPENLSVVEMGSYRGESSEMLAQKFSDVTCIDSWEWDGGEEEFDRRTEGKVTKIKARFENIELPEADFIYIDGDHDYESVKRDIKQALPKAGKYIGGHDYKEKFPGVIQAVDEEVGKPDKVFIDSSWLRIL